MYVIHAHSAFVVYLIIFVQPILKSNLLEVHRYICFYVCRFCIGLVASQQAIVYLSLNLDNCCTLAFIYPGLINVNVICNLTSQGNFRLTWQVFQPSLWTLSSQVGTMMTWWCRGAKWGTSTSTASFLFQDHCWCWGPPVGSTTSSWSQLNLRKTTEMVERLIKLVKHNPVLFKLQIIFTLNCSMQQVFDMHC